jgi:hypothetical protein
MKSQQLEKTVTLPLSEAGRKTFFTRLASDNYYNWMLSILMPFDLLFTYFFRYDRVAYNDMINAQHPHSTNNNGPAIEYTMQHPAVGGAISVVFISIAALSAYWEVNRQEKLKNTHSAKYIYDQLKTVMYEQKTAEHLKKLKISGIADEGTPVFGIEEEKEENAETKAEHENKMNQMMDIQPYIEEFFASDEHLQKKYQRIAFVDDSLKVVFKPGKAKPKHHNEPRVISRATGIDETEEDSPQDEMKDTPPPTPSVAALTATNNSASVKSADKKEDKPGLIKQAFQLFINKFLYPVWQSTVLMSFVYWIEWIGGGIFTGDFNPWGVAGVPNALAFGLPVLAGLTYPVIKIYNYYTNKPSNIPNEPTLDEQDEAEKDMSILLRRALALREYVISKKDLLKNINSYQSEVNRHKVESLGQPRPVESTRKKDESTVSTSKKPTLVYDKMDEEIKQLRDPKRLWAKPTIAFFSVALGSYVGLQYCTWILTALANLLFGASVKVAMLTAAGIPLLAGAALYGLYQAYEAYQGQVKLNSKRVLSPEQADLEKKEHDEIAQLERELAELRLKLGGNSFAMQFTKTPVNHLETQFFADPKRHGPSKWTGLNKFGARAFQFINGGCTGIFLARVFFVEGSAISLPFAAAAFSYPVTIAILAGVGAVFGAFKVYEYTQSRNDAHLKNLIDTRTERLECLRREVDLLSLSVNLRTVKAEHDAIPKQVNKVRHTNGTTVSSVAANGLYSGKKNGMTNGNGTAYHKSSNGYHLEGSKVKPASSATYSTLLTGSLASVEESPAGGTRTLETPPVVTRNLGLRA